MFLFLLHNVCGAWAIFQEGFQGWRLLSIVQFPLLLPLYPNKEQAFATSLKHVKARSMIAESAIFQSTAGAPKHNQNLFT